MRLRHVIEIAALSLIAQGASAQVNLVNGGFESPVVPSPGFNIFASIPGWTTAFGAGIEVPSGGIAGTPFEGNPLVETDSAGNSGFRQVVPTVAGQAYALDFVYSRAPAAATAIGRRSFSARSPSPRSGQSRNSRPVSLMNRSSRFAGRCRYRTPACVARSARSGAASFA
jgi:hypothetical protein